MITSIQSFVRGNEFSFELETDCTPCWQHRNPNAMAPYQQLQGAYSGQGSSPSDGSAIAVSVCLQLADTTQRM